MAVSDVLRGLASNTPIGKNLAERYFAGDTLAEALDTARSINSRGFLMSLTPLPVETSDGTRTALTALIDGIANSELASTTDVSCRFSELGSVERERRSVLHGIVEQAREQHVSLFLEAEEGDLVDQVIDAVVDNRRDHVLGVTLAARLRRTESDLRELVESEVPIRLCKGAYDYSKAESFSSTAEADKAFVRCLKIALNSASHICVATHDARLIEIAQALAIRFDRRDYELQFWLGANEGQASRALEDRNVVRLYAPFGDNWPDFLVQRLSGRWRLR